MSQSPLNPAASWSDTIKDAKHARVTLPWDRAGLKPEPVQYITRYQKSREECEYNPVLGVYTDPSREREAQQKAASTTVLEANRARDKQLAQRQTYDVISHRPIVKEPEPAPPRPKQADTRAKYNIVSNLDYSEHHYLPPSERPPPLVSPTRRLVKTVIPHFEKKDFDLISNKYVKDHDAKDAVDKELAKRAAADRFWQTRDFDPIVGTFHDRTKEAAFLAERDERAAIHPTLAGATLPPVAKSSEGEAYNVISNLPKDEDKLRVVDHKQTRTVLHRVHTQVEAHVVNTTMAREEKEDGRKIGRIAHRRYADDVGHGHDIISNKPFQGIDAKTTFSPRTRKPTDTWVKVEHADSRMRSTSASATGNSSRPLFTTKRMTAGGDSPAPSVAVGSGAGSVRTGGFSFN